MTSRRMAAWHVVCLVAWLPLAGAWAETPEEAFEAWFGQEARTVAEAGGARESILLARKVLDRAKGLSDGALCSLLCHRAHALALEHQRKADMKVRLDGYHEADRAVAVLRKVAPDRTGEADELELKTLNLRYRLAPVEADTAYYRRAKTYVPVKGRWGAGDDVIDKLVSMGGVLMGRHKAGEAEKLFRRASAIAQLIRSPRKAEIVRRQREAIARRAVDERAEALREKLGKDPTDAAAAKALLEIALVHWGNASEALKLLDRAEPGEPLKTYLPLAAGSPKNVDPDVWGELGRWYGSLGVQAGPHARKRMVRYALWCYSKFLVKQRKRDGLYLKMRLERERLLKEYRRLEAQLRPGPNPPVPLELTLPGGVWMHVVPIEPGTFVMGEETGKYTPDPKHRVTITRPYYIGRTEVTWRQYRALVPGEAIAEKDLDRPAAPLTWHEVAEFCRRMALAVKKPVRLPTEAEWEYACRAGSTTRFCYGDEIEHLGAYAWTVDSSPYNKCQPVRLKRPNAFGLYDMHGNAAEWCQDWHVHYTQYTWRKKPVTDPRGPEISKLKVKVPERVYRGGTARIGLPERCSSAYRRRARPNYKRAGLRVAISRR